MTAIFQQLVMESWDLKKEVRELRQTCELLRAENLKLKNAILHTGASLQDFLQAILEDADETAVEAKEAGPGVAGAVR